MRKTLVLILTLSILMLMSVTASARPKDRHDDDRYHQKHRYHDNQNWRHAHDDDDEVQRGLPFRWHERHRDMRYHHRMERIHDWEWSHRFPGARAYKWHGPGFWHHGRYVDKAVLFFDKNDRLISIGYMANGVFIHIREDRRVYENHDSFFIGWWHR